MRSSRYLFIPCVSDDDATVIPKAYVLNVWKNYDDLFALLGKNFGDGVSFYIYEQDQIDNLAEKLHEGLQPRVLENSVYGGSLSTAGKVLRFVPSPACSDMLKDFINRTRIKMMPKSDSEPELLQRYHDNFYRAVCETVKNGCDQSALVTANADRSVYSLIYPDSANDETYLLVGDGSGSSVWQQLKKINLATQRDQITIYYLSSDGDGATMSLHTLQLRFNLKSDPVANATDRAYLDSCLKDCPPDTSDAEIKKHFIPTVCQFRQSSQCFSGDYVVAISKKIVTYLTNEWSGCLTQLVMKGEDEERNRQDEMIAREISGAPQGGDEEFEDHFEAPFDERFDEPQEVRAVAMPSRGNSLFKNVSSPGRTGQDADDPFLRYQRAGLAEVLKISCRDLISALNERKWNVVHLYKKQPSSVIEMVDYLESMIKSTKPFTERDVLKKLQEIADKHSGQKIGRHPTTITFMAIVVSARNLQEIIDDVKEIDAQQPRPSGQ